MPVAVDAPAWIEIVLRRQPRQCAPGGRERLLVHLVNPHGDRPTDNNYRCTEQILPVRDVQVRMRLPLRPARVTLEPDGATPVWNYGDGVLHVLVPEVMIHRVIAVEMGN